MPTYEFGVEFVGEKKPRAKMPPFEMSKSPVENGSAGVRRSSGLQKQIDSSRTKTGRGVLSIMSSLAYVFEDENRETV
jgi:hypothetical protein